MKTPHSTVDINNCIDYTGTPAVEPISRASYTKNNNEYSGLSEGGFNAVDFKR